MKLNLKLITEIVSAFMLAFLCMFMFSYFSLNTSFDLKLQTFKENLPFAVSMGVFYFFLNKWLMKSAPKS